MTAAVAAPTPLLPEDRLGLMLCLAVIFHTIVILGVIFTPEKKPPPRYQSMDVVLVQRSSETADDAASLLAQANLQGGGDTMEEVVPAIPLPRLPPAPTMPEPEPVAPETAQQATVPATETPPPPAEALTAQTDAATVPEETDAPSEPVKPESERPSATALLTRSLQIAALSAETKRKLEARAKRPKKTFISANTREYKYAAYMESWRHKVVRVGNVNYPEEARRRGISGQLRLDVALNPDGSINQVTILKSSGHHVLDEAAVRIVKLAAPYADFPDNISKDTDILHITRTWQFLDKRGFR